MKTIDRYRIIKEIARGGQSRICLCYDPKVEERVVIKIVERGGLGEKEAMWSFAREADALLRLDHPNIVRLHEFKNDGPNGDNYLVMEYVEGKSLADLLRGEGFLPPSESVRIALDVCAALSAAHRKGIIHKDVKPSNILLTGNGRAKLSDFGISSSADDPTDRGARFGTVCFMAPELSASSDGADARSDLYSLGVTLYQMLTGTVPFRGSDAISISVRHVLETPVRPQSLNRDIPLRLDAVVMKLLNKKASERYQNADELSVRLRSIISTPDSVVEPPDASPPSVGDRAVIR